MKWLPTTYRTGFFLLIAALIIFLFGELFASTFSEAPADGGRGGQEGGSSWIASTMHLVAGVGAVLLLVSGLVEALRAKRGGEGADQ